MNADATSGEFYKILPGEGELSIHLRKEMCGQYCMYRINFRQLPDGLVTMSLKYLQRRQRDPLLTVMSVC